MVENIQRLLDGGMSANRIAIQLGVHHSKIIRLIARHNIEIYEAFDENLPPTPTYWMYSDEYYVAKSNYGYKDKLECVRDAVSKFVSEFDPDEITSKLLKEYRYIETYVYMLHDNLQSFYDFYNLDGDFISYSQESKRGQLTRLGHEFQRLVTRTYDEIPLARHSTRGYGESVPDYISGNTWIDAKLSKSTALNYGCKTIDKYRNHTEHLVILYALDDTNATDDRATFVSITDFLPMVSEELQRNINIFIRKAAAIKYGGAA